MAPIAKARGEPVNQPDGLICCAKKQSPGPVPLERVEILTYNNSPNDRRLTRALIDWARQVGLKPSVVPIDQDVP